MNTSLTQLLPYLAAAVPGSIAGFLYYRYIGCKSGVCMLTRNPVSSSLVGAFVGIVIADIFFR